MTMNLTETVEDPAAFAAELYSALSADGDRRSPVCLTGYAPAEHAAFEGAYAAAKAAVGDGPLDDGHRELLALSDAAYEMANAAHDAGVRFGIAAEAFRRRLLGGEGA